MHVYLFSGLGVDNRAFQNIVLQDSEIIHIKWIDPLINESMKDYARRLIAQIKTTNPILVGLSFGGMIAVEVAKLVKTKKVILISSAKGKKNIPYYFRFLGVMGMHRLLPIQRFKRANKLVYWFFGVRSGEDRELLSDILKTTDERFLVINPGNFSTIYQYERIKAELEKIPGVRHVAYSSGYGKYSDKFDYALKYNGIRFECQYMSVDREFVEVMHARLVAGRNFSSVHADSLGELIVNAKLAANLNISKNNLPVSVQAFGRNQSIVGIVDNLNLYGFEEDIAPMMVTTNKYTITPYILADIDPKRVTSCIKSIDRLWKEVEPEYPLRFQFLDATFQQLYSTYDGLSRVFNLFTICAVLIAFSGLFGIVATVTLQRTKEIAIRKVLGATVMQILQWLNREFIALVILASIISFPIAWYLSVKWLNNFAFRINIPIYPFAVAIVALTMLTILTVCAEALKKAMGNPVEALKHE